MIHNNYKYQWGVNLKLYRTCFVLLLFISQPYAQAWEFLCDRGKSIDALSTNCADFLNTDSLIIVFSIINEGIFHYDLKNKEKHPLYSAGETSFPADLKTCSSLAISPYDNSIIAGTKNGLYEINLDVSNPQWTKVVSVPSEQITSTTIRNSKHIVTTNTKIYHKADSLNTWMQFTLPDSIASKKLSFNDVSIYSGNTNHMVVSSANMKDSQTEDFVIETTDYGLNWEIIFNNTVSNLKGITSVTLFKGTFNSELSYLITIDSMAWIKEINDPLWQTVDLDNDTGKINDVTVHYFSWSNHAYFATSATNGGSIYFYELENMNIFKILPLQGRDANEYIVATNDGLFYFNIEGTETTEYLHSDKKSHAIHLKNNSKEMILLLNMQFNGRSNVTLFNSQGKQLGFWCDIIRNSFTIQTKFLPKGMYYILIENKNGLVWKKFPVI